jgi:hypothetical protein
VIHANGFSYYAFIFGAHSFILRKTRLVQITFKNFVPAFKKFFISIAYFLRIRMVGKQSLFTLRTEPMKKLCVKLLNVKAVAHIVITALLRTEELTGVTESSVNVLVVTETVTLCSV